VVIVSIDLLMWLRCREPMRLCSKAKVSWRTV